MSDPTEDCASLPVSSWLAALHLDQYSATFRQHRFRTASDCRTITEADLTRLGVLLPAHRRRILLSLRTAFPPQPHPGPNKPIPAQRRVFRSAPPNDPPTPPNAPPTPPNPPPTPQNPPLNPNPPPNPPPTPPNAPPNDPPTPPNPPPTPPNAPLNPNAPPNPPPTPPNPPPNPLLNPNPHSNDPPTPPNAPPNDPPTPQNPPPTPPNPLLNPNAPPNPRPTPPNPSPNPNPPSNDPPTPPNDAPTPQNPPPTPPKPPPTAPNAPPKPPPTPPNAPPNDPPTPPNPPPTPPNPPLNPNAPPNPRPTPPNPSPNPTPPSNDPPTPPNDAPTPQNPPPTPQNDPPTPPNPRPTPPNDPPTPQNPPTTPPNPPLNPNPPPNPLLNPNAPPKSPPTPPKPHLTPPNAPLNAPSTPPNPPPTPPNPPLNPNPPPNDPLTPPYAPLTPQNPPPTPQNPPPTPQNTSLTPQNDPPTPQNPPPTPPNDAPTPPNPPLNPNPPPNTLPDSNPPLNALPTPQNPPPTPPNPHLTPPNAPLNAPSTPPNPPPNPNPPLNPNPPPHPRPAPRSRPPNPPLNPIPPPNPNRPPHPPLTPHNPTPNAPSTPPNLPLNPTPPLNPPLNPNPPPSPPLTPPNPPLSPSDPPPTPPNRPPNPNPPPTAPHPPPIPPRVGCGPPVLFAPPPLRAAVDIGVPPPPLPAKRQQRPQDDEGEMGTPPPPGGIPPALPPRLGAQREGGSSAAHEDPPAPPPPPDFDDSDYEDHCSPGTTPQAAVGRQQRLCSASSEEELPGDGQETHVGPTDPSADPTELLCTPIWAGWLDKMAPQGHYRYQRRWVTLDPQYLRYFDSDKDVFSKRFIPISSISRVAPIGEQKVEVLTQHRAFVFRADSDAERSQWLRVLQRAVAEQQERPPPPTWPHGDPPPADPIAAADDPIGSDPIDGPIEGPEGICGHLELRGFKHGVFVVLLRDTMLLYRSAEEQQCGVGVTAVPMAVGSVKDAERRSFALHTPYRTFSFAAPSAASKQRWMAAMRGAVAAALSHSGVTDRIWGAEPNRSCADCGAQRPTWASINLCVVICQRCAGEHRAMGPNVSKVRSLEMDRRVWTEPLIQLLLRLHNGASNAFWAAHVPPSERIAARSSASERRRFLTAKYRHGKFRRFHPLYGQPEELNRALCMAVTTSDVAETQSLLFCGADVSCPTGDPKCPTPLDLAQRSGQRLQMEFLQHNRTSEPPCPDLGCAADRPYSRLLPSVTHCGFLYKTPSMAKALSERKGQEEFSRRWCALQDGVLSYYESDRSTAPNGHIRAPEIVCLAPNPPHSHGLECTFEVYTDSERLYLFGSDSPESAREWLRSIAQSFVPPCAEELLERHFDRLGRLMYKGGLSLETPQEGWFALVGSVLYVCSGDGERHEAVQLRKLQELSIQGDNEVLVLVERRRTLYIHGERRLDFVGWLQAIQKAAGSGGAALGEQQLTEGDVPVLVDRCIDYITQCGLTSEGIYRKSGQNSKTTHLLETLRRDARSVRLKEGQHHVDDVANALKRFFRDLTDSGIFTQRCRHQWLRVTAMEDEEERMAEYRRLLAALPAVNRATLKALINHLFRVQRFAGENQMSTHNLAIVFGPTLFQSDGKDYTAGRVVEELIANYVEIFNVDEEEMRKQQHEIAAIMKMREAASSGTQQAGDFICTVYLEEKRTEMEQHVKIPATMTAEELTCEILGRRKMATKEKDYWSCFEVNEREEAERPLHYSEKVLPIVHSLGTDSYLVVKKQLSMENMLVYLASRVGDSKHGMMKFCEERNLLGLGLSTGFHDRYFILNHTSLRLYKEVRSHKPEREWAVRSLRVYLGVKKKLRPPTCWGFTVFHENEKHERQQWYLCCDTQTDLREWFATFLHVQTGGSLWPSQPLIGRPSRRPPDPRLSSAPLIPLRRSDSADPHSALHNT